MKTLFNVVILRFRENGRDGMVMAFPQLPYVYQLCFFLRIVGTYAFLSDLGLALLV